MLGALQVENFGALAGPGTRVLAELPAEQYPLLSETASHAKNICPREEFRRGLDILVAGLDPASSA